MDNTDYFVSSMNIKQCTGPLVAPICKSCDMKEYHCLSAESRRPGSGHYLLTDCPPIKIDSGTSCGESSRSLRCTIFRTNMSIIATTMLLLSSLRSSYGNILRPRSNERVNNIDTNHERILRMGHKAVEDLPPSEEATSMSMSLSFDISVKSLDLGDKSLASGKLSVLMCTLSFSVCLLEFI